MIRPLVTLPYLFRIISQGLWREDPQHARPLWIGFLAASLTPAACVAVYALALENFSLAVIDLIKVYLLMSVFAFPVAVVTLLVVALPIVLWLKRTKRLSFITVCAGAIVAGSLSWALVTWLSVWNSPVPGFKEFAVGALIGLASGIVFSTAAGLTIRSRRARFAASCKF